MDAWQTQHRDWDYVLWTDAMNDALVARHYPALLAGYRAYRYGVQRADVARVLYLHRYGGIYSDLDIEPNRPFDDLVAGDAGVYLMADGPFMRFTNMLMASAPGEAFWNDVLAAMAAPRVPWWAHTPHFFVMATTGPLLLDRAAKTCGRPIGLWPGARLQPCSNCDAKPCTKPGAYTTMLEGGSWNRWDSRVIRAIACLGRWRRR